jgi:hypothetical protein
MTTPDLKGPPRGQAVTGAVLRVGRDGVATV